MLAYNDFTMNKLSFVPSPYNAFLSPQLWCTLPEGIPPANSSLHTDLHRLHWTEGNIGKELCTGRGSQVETCAIQIAIFLWLWEKYAILPESGYDVTKLRVFNCVAHKSYQMI